MGSLINRRERKKINSKKAIVDAAVKLFLQKGYGETSIAEIMNEADLGIGTFYNYFQSKEDILMHFLAKLISETNKFYLNLSKEPKAASVVLAEMFLFTGRILAENRFVLPLFLSAAHKTAAHKNSPPSAEGLTFKAIFDNIIKQGQEKGEFRQDIPAEVITEMFHSVFQAASFSSLPFPFRENIEYKLKLILDGLTVKADNG
ncbi:TetR/AcrR family transcriptional regulator|uniref:Transcriptional regulator, TetR family n=1 Tax=Dendrosporobacter quercicolus TaxID=146817 RepID=A0A1G9TW53_9FIRM|nr:TetR/AcrR family transcriptional regulator [Dendrosporobacter quercicolus]NSL48831.1 TetR/AcrR family transcriptional regulator [Dendrosporobacter quercicolus DSM 1736]SDM51903.1 transcriptional regulator, TetR family [Dendrosporobacter quercicolus]